MGKKANRKVRVPIRIKNNKLEFCLSQVILVTTSAALVTGFALLAGFAGTHE